MPWTLQPCSILQAVKSALEECFRRQWRTSLVVLALPPLVALPPFLSSSANRLRWLSWISSLWPSSSKPYQLYTSANTSAHMA